MREPAYVTLAANDELSARAQALLHIYERCTLCPHNCGVNRIRGQRGRCRSGSLPVVASANAHFGEEPPISGTQGSGTIFFSNCTGTCIFCQNYPISQLGTGTEVSIDRLADMMITLQSRGCHNINLVTPTHFIPSIVAALDHAVTLGLRIPLVYNSSGYESIDILEKLDGIIDIYLPDIKYANSSIAEEISGFHAYVTNNRAAIKEMYRQVGELEVVDGIAVHGCIIRHLILPDNLAGTEQSLEFLANAVSKNIYISLMDQYFPAYHAIEHESMSRKISKSEYDRAITIFHEAGLKNGWIQDHQ